MRRFLTIAMLTTAFVMVGAIGAMAADKAGPAPQPYQAPAGIVVEPGHFTGLHVEGSVAAANFKAAEIGTDSFGLFGAGIGYDHKIAPSIIGGVFVRYDFSRNDDARLLHLGARAGFLLNPHLLLYVPVSYAIDGNDIKIDSGIWSAGVGLETALLVNKLSIFGEVTRNFALQGDARWLDEVYQFRAGVRLRF